MSAPSRAQRDGTMMQGHGPTTPALRGRTSSRGSLNISSRGRGRGRGAPTTNPRAEGLLQGRRSGTLNKRSSEDGSSQSFSGKRRLLNSSEAPVERGTNSAQVAVAPHEVNLRLEDVAAYPSPSTTRHPTPGPHLRRHLLTKIS